MEFSLANCWLQCMTEPPLTMFLWLLSKLFTPSALMWVSHTLDRLGETFSTPTHDEFTSARIQFFSHSPKAHLAWRTQTGLSVK